NWEELIQGYEARITEWVANIELRRSELERWDRAAFWTTVTETARNVPQAAREFINAWLDGLLESGPSGLVRDPAVRERIRHRERKLKGELARLHNPSALARWGGASSAAA